MSKTMKCSELKPFQEIVFKVDPYHNGNKSYWTGNVILVNSKNKTICVSYLEGYKDRKDDIPFEDCIAVYDKNGENMKFGPNGHIYGPSVLLTAE